METTAIGAEILLAARVKAAVLGVEVLTVKVDTLAAGGVDTLAAGGVDASTGGARDSLAAGGVDAFSSGATGSFNE